MTDSITYRSTGIRGAIGWTSVYLGRKKIGEIRPVPNGGYQYVTQNGTRGNVFKTPAEVRRSLEAA